MRNWIFATMVAIAMQPSISLGLTGETVAYEVDGETYEGYYTTPGDNVPLVLLIHDWDGLTDYERRRADMLAQMGYAVFAADLFGAGVRPKRVEDKRQHTGELYQDREKMRALMRGALEAAVAKGASTRNAVAMGYCFGGAAVLELARAGADLKGFATFHGGLKTPPGQDYSMTKGSVLIMHGSADNVVSMQEFAALANELEAAAVSHQMATYGNAPHGFTVFSTERYREEADRKSWSLFSEFLRETLQ